MSTDPSDLKLHTFIVLRSFEGRSGNSKISIPKDYVFTAKGRSYSSDLEEKIDLFIDSDEGLFSEPVVFLGVPCSMVGYYEE